MTRIPVSILLTDDQLAYLRVIYQRKRRLLQRGGGGVMALWLYSSINKLTGLLNNYDHEAFRTKLIAGIVTILLVLFFLAAICWFIYLKYLLPLKKDIRDHSGSITYKQIIRKSRMPVKEEYFIFFDELEMPYKQISRDEYHTYKIGDEYPVLTAEQSNIQIDGFWNYTLF